MGSFCEMEEGQRYLLDRSTGWESTSLGYREVILDRHLQLVVKPVTPGRIRLYFQHGLFRIYPCSSEQ